MQYPNSPAGQIRLLTLCCIKDLFLTAETRRTQSDMDVNKITEQVIGAAMEVHRSLGPGLLEAVTRSVFVMSFLYAM